jgi:hypothetical protein
MPASQFDPPPQPPPPPTGKPDRRALLQAYQDVVRATQERPAPRRLMVPDRTPFWIGVILLILGLIALLVFQPGWLFNRPPAESPQVQEASLRIRMYVEIDRVERFRQAHGKLPVNLAEAGGDSTGLSFEHRGEGYILSGSNGQIQLRYQSGESPEAFLGNSYQAVRERSQVRGKK